MVEAAQYVAVDSRRALEDLLLHRLGKPPHPEAYFLPWARRLREATDTTVVLVAEQRLVARARPFIREPASSRAGRECDYAYNLCLTHEGHHSLRAGGSPVARRSSTPSTASPGDSSEARRSS